MAQIPIKVDLHDRQVVIVLLVRENERIFKFSSAEPIQIQIVLTNRSIMIINSFISVGLLLLFAVECCFKVIGGQQQEEFAWLKLGGSEGDKSSKSFREPKQLQPFKVNEALTTTGTRLLWSSDYQANQFKPITSSRPQQSYHEQFHQSQPPEAGRIRELPGRRLALLAPTPQQQQQQFEATSNSIEQDISSRAGVSDAINKKESIRKCQRLEPSQASKPGLKRVLQSATKVLTDGIRRLERSAIGGNLMVFGSSILAAAIPVLALLVPADLSSIWATKRHGMTNKSMNLISDSQEPPRSGSSIGHIGSSIHGQLDSVMGWIERSVEHLPNFPRLHPQECVKRSICEAHNDPSKFGAIGLLLRLLFPATNLSSTDRMDNMDFKVINKYKHAAGFGANKRLDNNGTSTPGACKEKYEDCLVNLLEVGQNLIDMFLVTTNKR